MPAITRSQSRVQQLTTSKNTNKKNKKTMSRNDIQFTKNGGLILKKDQFLARGGLIITDTLGLQQTINLNLPGQIMSTAKVFKKFIPTSELWASDNQTSEWALAPDGWAWKYFSERNYFSYDWYELVPLPN